jgi:hypothetical protein
LEGKKGKSGNMGSSKKIKMRIVEGAGKWRSEERRGKKA